MPDLLTLLQAMAAALRGPGPLDWATIAPSIGLRFDGVRAIGRSSSASAIEGGTLIQEGLPVDGVIFQAPRPQISLLFPDKTPSDPNFCARQFAADQHIAESRTGRGRAIVFSIGDVTCAILVTEHSSRVSPSAFNERPAKRANHQSVRQIGPWRGAPMSSKLFEIMKLLESKRIHFGMQRSSPFGVLLTAAVVGKRIEISADEDDMVDVSIFRGDETVEVGIEAVVKALEADE
jgi:hypothetical protein